MKSNRKYSIPPMIMGIPTILMVLYSMVHPRPSHILSALLAIILWSRMWKKRKRESYEEPNDYKNYLKEQGRYVLWFVALGIVMALPSVLSMDLFPYHAPYEYHDEIERLKAMDGRAYAHFPADIPEGAKAVCWYYTPAVGGTEEKEVLTFQISGEYIEYMVEQYDELIPEDVKKYAEQMEELHIEGTSYNKYDMPWSDHLTEEEMDEIEDYRLYDNGSWTDHDCFGYFVIPSESLIGFYRERR